MSSVIVGLIWQFPERTYVRIAVFDSWLYDNEKPFIHLDAIETFNLKEQVNTNYFEELIQKYLLDNTHASIVVVEAEKGRTARLKKELDEKFPGIQSKFVQREKWTDLWRERLR